VGVQRAALLQVALLPDVSVICSGCHLLATLEVSLTLEQFFAVLALEGPLQVSSQFLLIQKPVDLLITRFST
jgi:hypothetical protein